MGNYVIHGCVKSGWQKGTLLNFSKRAYKGTAGDSGNTDGRH